MIIVYTTYSTMLTFILSSLAIDFDYFISLLWNFFKFSKENTTTKYIINSRCLLCTHHVVSEKRTRCFLYINTHWATQYMAPLLQSWCFFYLSMPDITLSPTSKCSNKSMTKSSKLYNLYVYIFLSLCLCSWSLLSPKDSSVVFFL